MIWSNMVHDLPGSVCRTAGIAAISAVFEAGR